MVPVWCSDRLQVKRTRMALSHNLRTAAWIGGPGGFFLSAPVKAQEVSLTDILPAQNVANSGIMLIIFVGAFAFAMWSATWLIRERRLLEENNRRAELELADLKARHERAQALLDVPDQRIVIWENREEAPVCRGQLPENTAAPADPTQFIAFGTWMSAQSAQSFEHAVDRLRRRAESFDLAIETRSGTVIEVQGRASGSHAFVRFISLSGDRAALAALEYQHTRLMQTTDTMKSLLEAIPFPVWLRDQQNSLTWANHAYVEAVEGDDLEAVSQENRHLLDANARKQVADLHQRERQTQNTSQFHDRLPATISGDRRMMDVSEVSYAGGSAGMAVDMSEVEEVQSNLRRTLESHAQTMNQLATAVAIFDARRHLIFHNDAFENLWGLEPRFLDDEPDNGSFFDALREAGKIAEQPDWSKWRNGLLQVYESTQPVEDWWHLPDGRTLRVVASPQKQGGVTWVFENITEQLEMESRYIALTQVQGETLDHLGEAIAVFASDGHLKLSNPSFQQLWALEDEQVAADTPVTKIAELCSKTMNDPTVWQTLSTGITGVSDARKTLSGRMTLNAQTVLDYALVPLPNGQTLLSFADISASVNLEHTLKERNEALEAAERLKNAFIEHVSYEFRAPLTSIKGFAELLQQQAFGPLNSKQCEYVGHITSSSNVLHSLVDNLLDLATVDAGIMELDLQEIDLRDTMRTAAKSVAELLREKRLTLNLKPARHTESNGQFVADANRVQQVLYNLLSNAVTFSPEGSTIGLESYIDADSVGLRVSDMGPGIPVEQQSTIFERFSGHAQKGGRRGAGLGLAIARSLVELHGGLLELDVTVGSGTSFVCRFPKLPGADTAPAREAAQ
jgi:signal transduction histidine kinase/PAS domain-containing protein